MVTDPGIPEHRFPMLLERSNEGFLDAEGRAIPDGHPSDIFLAEYVEAESIDRDAVLVVRPAAPSPADDRDPTWMPDGRIAFISDRDGEDRLYAARPGQPRPDLLVDASGVRAASFSPDGREMAYLVEGPDGCVLWRAEPEGTRAARVAIEGACHIAYAPDGQTLLVQRQGPPDVLGLYALDLGSGDVKRLVKGDVHHAAFSPDGRTLAYIRADDEAESLCLRSLATGDERVLVDAVPEGVLDLTFTPDGSRLVLHAGMERHQGTLAWFETSTPTSRPPAAATSARSATRTHSAAIRSRTARQRHDRTRGAAVTVVPRDLTEGSGTMYSQCRNICGGASMRPHVQKWGNSLAVRIPSTLAREAGLESGTPVDLRINSDGDLVIRRDRLPHYRLEGLVAGITPENRHAEVDASPPRGREMI